MAGINLMNVDLNLLVVLDVLLEERSVTRAAKRLHRTQSAMSHALGRLRDELGDPLLVRVGGEMRPTPKAESLVGDLSRILQMIHRVLGAQSAFDPATSDRVFTLTGPDFVGFMMPALLKRAAREAPMASIELAKRDRRMFTELADGRFDLAVAPRPPDGLEGVRSEPIGDLEWVVFARKGHPAARAWSAEAWATWPHVVVRTPSDVENPVDRAVRAQGLTRRLRAFLPHFSLAPPLLAETDLLLTVPREALASIAPQFDLIALESPLQIRPVPLAMHWSARLDRDQAIGWFRATAKASLADTLRAGERLKVVPLAGSRRRPAKARR